MNKKEIELWKRLRSRGFWHFVVMFGFVRFGIVGGLIWSVLFWVIFFKLFGLIYTKVSIHGEVSLWYVLSFSMVWWPLSTTLLSPVIWVIAERSYKKAAETDSVESN